MSELPEAEQEPVPKLPRGRGIKLSGPELFRIALTLITLIGLLVLTRPCANAVSNFVTSFDQGSGQDQAMPKPGNVDVPASGTYERLHPGMSEQEIEAAIERAKANAARGSAASGPSAGSGSAASGPSAGSGSAASTPPAHGGSGAPRTPAATP